jgi:hypothetical protein
VIQLHYANGDLLSPRQPPLVAPMTPPEVEATLRPQQRRLLRGFSA